MEEGPGGAGWPAGRLGEVSRPRVAWRDSGSVDLPPAGERRGKSDALVGTMETRSWTKAAKQLPFTHTLVLPVYLAALVAKPLLYTLKEHRGSVCDGPGPRQTAGSAGSRCVSGGTHPFTECITP